MFFTKFSLILAQGYKYVAASESRIHYMAVMVNKIN